MRLTIILYVVFAILYSCQKPEDITREKIHSTLTTFLTQTLYELDSTYTLDSIKIISVDTFTDKHRYLINFNSWGDSVDYYNALISNYIDRAKLNRQIESIDRDLGIYSNYHGEEANDLLKDAELYLERMEVFRSSMDSVSQLLDAGGIDTVTFKNYLVLYKICYSDRALVQTCYDSSQQIISPDFRIIKKESFLQEL